MDYNVKEGRFFYARHRIRWGVWKKGKMENGVRMNEFISDFSTQEQAKNFVYKMNGYTPKQ